MGEATPSDLLTQAADLIRDTAAAATDGPWRMHDTWLDAGGHTATVLADAQPRIPLVAWLPTWEPDPWGQERRCWQNAKWIALLNPAVAPALEQWLRETAKYMRWEIGAASSEEAGHRFQEGKYAGALALAKALLGTPEEEK